MLKDFFIKTSDSLQLYTIIEKNPDPRGAVVIVHGLNEYQGRYDEFAAYLFSQGFSVYRFDHRGHGLSEGPRAFFPERDTMVEDIATIVEMAVKDNEGIPVFLLGHSMGGLGVDLYGTKYPGRVCGIITIGGWLYDDSNAASRVYDMDPTDYIAIMGADICSDQAVIDRYMADPLIGKKTSAGLYQTCLSAQKWMWANIEKFTDPVLILQGGDDKITPEYTSRDFFDKLKAADKSLMVFAGLGHEILNEPCRRMIYRYILDWIEMRL